MEVKKENKHSKMILKDFKIAICIMVICCIPQMIGRETDPSEYGIKLCIISAIIFIIGFITIFRPFSSQLSGDSINKTVMGIYSSPSLSKNVEREDTADNALHYFINFTLVSGMIFIVGIILLMMS